MFEGPEAGPGVKEVKGVDLLGLYREAALKGSTARRCSSRTWGSTAWRHGRSCSWALGSGQSRASTRVRRARARSPRQLSKRGSVATTLAQASGRNAADAVQAVVEGLILGAYRFDRYKSKKDDPPSLERVTVLGAARWDTKAAKVAVERARIVGESAVWARDLVNTPAET